MTVTRRLAIAATLALVAAPAWAGPDDISAALTQATHAMVNDGHIAGVVSMVAHDGRVVHHDAYGVQSVDTGAPMTMDTIFAIASMTKPVTGVAMMILFEEGKWALDDTVAQHLPELANMQVQLEDGTRVPADTNMTMRQLVSHSAGFAYGLGPSSLIDQLYYDADISAVDQTTAQFLAKLADLPLAYQPGENWVYSIAVDVQGAVVERLSGQSFADFAWERIFEPLRMTDTAFYVPAEKHDRLARIHTATENGLSVMESSFHFGRAPDVQPAFSSGGAGLYSTAGDYLRFTQMLLNGGELDGARILSPGVASLMHTNLLDGRINDGGFTAPGNGTGFGVDFGILMNPAATNDPRGAGTYYWGGAFGTFFWIDPANDLSAVVMLQRLGAPAPGAAPFDPQGAARTAIYGALAR